MMNRKISEPEKLTMFVFFAGVLVFGWVRDERRVKGRKEKRRKKLAEFQMKSARVMMSSLLCIFFSVVLAKRRGSEMKRVAIGGCICQ